MFRTLSFSVSLFAALSSNAQNLVQNPGFEQYSQCPGSVGQLDKCDGWSTPTVGSPDYFGTCTNYLVGIPDNIFGSQQPYAGNAYAGVINYFHGGFYKEYMEGHLTAPMQPGQYYRVSMRVSFSEENEYAAAGLGILFSVDSIYSTNTIADVLPYTPQVDYTSYGIISDTVNWITLTDTILADSSYKFLAIGSFDPNDSVDTDSVGYGQHVGAYYYVDDVEVIPLPMSIASYPVSEMSVHPNPLVVNSTVSFKNTERAEFTFNMYDALGRSVRTITGIRSDQFDIAKNDLPAGLYFYQLSSSSKRYSGKLLVE